MRGFTHNLQSSPPNVFVTWGPTKHQHKVSIPPMLNSSKSFSSTGLKIIVSVIITSIGKL